MSRPSAMLRTMTVVLCVMLALTATPFGYAQTPSPSKQLDDTFARVLATVRDASLDAGTKEARVKELLASRLDYEKSGLMALGVHAKANRARMHEFVPLFRKLLEKVYVARIVGAAGEARLSVTDERIDGDYATVGATIAFKQNDVRAAFRLYKTEQGWMVYDITVEGISLLSNYRSQFHSIISKGSFDELLRRLREKTGQ